VNLFIVVDKMARNTPFNLGPMLEKDKLTANGSNYADWVRTLRIVLRGAKKEYVLDAPLPEPPVATATDDEKNVYATIIDDSTAVQCLMLACMDPELQKRFENSGAFDILQMLKAMYQKQARTERYEITKLFWECKMAEGSSVSEHVVKMVGYATRLESLGFAIPEALGTDILLASLPPSYGGFIMNYNMNGMDKSTHELFAMLKTAEAGMQKDANHVMMVNKTTSFKKKGKAKKGKGAGKTDTRPKSGATKETECFFCKGKGHWKRNCKKFLAERKKSGASSKGISVIHVIDVFLAGSHCKSWVFDTGSVAHICNSMQGLQRARKLARNEVQMRVGNGVQVSAQAVGVMPLRLPSGFILELNNCYFVPALCKNIISGSCLLRDGYSFNSENNGCSLYFKNMFYGFAPMVNGLFILDLDCSSDVLNVNAKRLKKTDTNTTYLWHCRLGHIGKKRMQKLHNDGVLESFDFESFDTCEACLMGKMTKTPFTGHVERASDLLEIIHSDVCGPMSVPARGGFLYFVTFTDDLSRYGYIYLMRQKSETFEKFKEFQNEVENHRNRKIKFLRSDRGGEYLSHEFSKHLSDCGIVPQLTPPGTPQRNGVSERRNRTLLDMVRSMMSLTELPLSFWGYALETAAFTLNRAPSKSVETTPYEIWNGVKPNLSFLKIWGCDAYVKRLQPNKLDPKSDKCYFVGYAKNTVGYSFYHRTEGKVFVAKNGTFLEKEFLAKEVSGRTVQLDEIVESSMTVDRIALPEVVPPVIPATEPEVPVLDTEASVKPVAEPRRTTRVRQSPQWFENEVFVLEDDEPANYKEAMAGPGSDKWRKAMKSEMESMYENQVWNLVDPPEGVKPIECKWIFKRKTDADGNVTIHKARLVAKGFRQVQGVDYDETFSPVAMLKSVRILLAIAAYFDYEIWQMDVKTAFLNGNLSEDVYMVQPEGFVDPKDAEKVCKLQRSIYGLKQASRSWNLRFDEVVKGFGFIQNSEEACVYKKESGSSKAFLILYVDDILLIGNDVNFLNTIKESLKKSFSMKDLGEAAYILGIKIYRDRSRRLIALSQSTYIDKVLKRFKMENAKKGLLPMSHGSVLSKKQCPQNTDERMQMTTVPYASAIGSIMYAMICTRPDVSFALSVSSRYQSDPGVGHWTAVKNILKYLNRTKEMFLVFGGDEELIVRGYTDASFMTDPDDFKSQSGYVFTLNGGAVSWKSSKQSTVADSTTEAEYVAASEASKEGYWIKKFVTELGVVPTALDPMELYCDNSGAVAQAKEPRSHQKSKHIERRFHIIRDFVDKGFVKICKIHTDLNVSDPMTKPLPRAKHEQHRNAIGVRTLM
jgi:hypothetical protein